MSKDKLTTKQRLFVEAYLANPNATEAARKAGYKGDDKQLSVIGAQNLAKVSISEAVAVRVEEAVTNANEVLTAVKTIAQSAERDADKLKAWEMLGKWLKLWTDKTELTGKDGGPVETKNTQPDLSKLSTEELLKLKEINAKLNAS